LLPTQLNHQVKELRVDEFLRKLLIQDLKLGLKLHEVLSFYLIVHQQRVETDLIFFQLKVLIVGQGT
jgi:hypothetical protein